MARASVIRLAEIPPSSATFDTRIAMGDLVLSNLAAHFAGRELKTPVV
jgi:hypothetical protein